MDKRTKAKLEREKLKQMLENNPRLVKFLESAVDNTDQKDLKDLIEPVLADTFEKIRMQGIYTGWYAHAARCVSKIKDCKTVDEAIEILNEDVKMAREKLGIKEEDNGSRNSD